VKPYSITRRLIATVLLIELVSALCVTGIALVYERHMHFRSFDILLRGRADSLLGAVQDAEDAEDNVMLDGTEVTVPTDDIYEVVDDRGRVLGHSANWSRLAQSGHKDKAKVDAHHPDQISFFRATVDGDTYRVIEAHGLRIVDPGEKGGGFRRNITVYYGSSVKRVWGAVLHAAAFYAISSIFVLACTGILMLWLLNRALAPLRGLTASASMVSTTSWAFLPPQEARNVIELSPLVSALETLLSGLQHAFEQQRRFVGDAAHELKTSAAVVKSSLQLLGMKQRTPQEYQSGLERCLDDCGRMESIVAQMLTLARVEETGARSQSSAFRTKMDVCLQEIVRELETMAETCGVHIRISGDSSIEANVDPQQFKLLSTNLLMNSIQHSPVNSEIAVEIRRQGTFSQVTIRDVGDGIAPQELPRIFERFSRSDSSRSRKTGGTGLGLAICKAIVDNFHGTIEIQSELNAGTTVTVQLPIADVISASAEFVE
jgi:signal transduction histidine kinase